MHKLKSVQQITTMFKYFTIKIICEVLSNRLITSYKRLINLKANTHTHIFTNGC